MGKAKLPASVKKGLETACRKSAEKVGKSVGAITTKNLGKKAHKKFQTKVCKDIDQKTLKLAFVQLRDYAKGKSTKGAKDRNRKIIAVPKMKAPGSGVPSLTLDLTEFDIDPKKGSKVKIQLKIWADPRDLENTEKGVFLNVSVVKFDLSDLFK